jgi:hypothetical protein
MLLYFDWCDLVVLVVFQVDLVGNVNQPDRVIYVSCRCLPFLLNHCALLILNIVHYFYKIMLLYFYWYQLVAPDASQDYLVGNDNQPDRVTCASCRCRPFLLNHCASLILIVLNEYRIMLLYFYWYQLVAPDVFQAYLVGNDNQPDGVTYVSCCCRPFLLNHCASLILNIDLYHYRIVL